MKPRNGIAYIKGYYLYIRGEEIEVYKDDELVTKQDVRLGMHHFKTFLINAKQLRLGWTRFPDFEVIYLFDGLDDNFGYAINLSAVTCSEWGYAPFKKS